ncbi:unnamed protein product [Bursaphelenchus okinawaensis]|uniref:glucuronosyltransferase n=1 Tax=Bursaphelenchus okinawaensis TaxID=465554 RepID=A0A811K1P4_9BILA|nr:unnamed protein product [Bursaphelenchus okinawaensis]CAG9089607.1 unnamed protein product [Bursaphelenchus okinawaensis]
MYRAVVLLLLLSSVESLKFLLYNPDNPGASKSHVILVDKLGDLLVDAGHEVVTYMPFVNDVSFHFKRKSRTEFYNVTMDVPTIAESSNIWQKDFEITEIGAWMKTLSDIATKSCETQLNDEVLMKKLEAEKFDFALIEYFDPCGLGIFHKIGIKRYSIVYSTQIHLIHARHVGIPTPTSFVPEITWSTPSKMTFFQRLWNFICNLVVEPYLIHSHIGGFNDVFASMGKTVYDLMAESGFIFINTDEYVDFPKPISHKIVNIGGIGMKKMLSKPQTLPEKYQKVYGAAKDGVVLVSWGSLARTVDIPQKSLQTLFDAFGDFPNVNFIVKYESDNVTVQVPTNVFMSGWLPQPAILAQNKTLTFMTHGGQNSVTEATYAGVPLVVVPLFGDQPRNAEAVKERGVAEILKKHYLNNKKKIVEVLRNVIYSENLQTASNELSHLMLSKPMSADERFVKHCEFGAQFDIHEHLDLHGRRLNFIQYHNLDVIAFIIGSVSLTLYILFKRAQFYLSYSKVKKDKNE